MYYQISIARVEIKRNDKSRHSRIAKLVRLPYWQFAENEQIASRASWSVSAGWIPIGNHFPACFLKVSTHQKQKLTHNVSGCLDTFNDKESKRVEKAQTCCENRRLQAFWRYCETELWAEVCILMMWLHQLKALIQKETFFFFFSKTCLTAVWIKPDLMQNFNSISSSGRNGVFILPHIAYIYQTFTLQAGDKDKSCKGRMSPAGWPSAH